jgi:hypothetical protein
MMTVMVPGGELLDIDQRVGRPHLAGGDDVLNLGHDHRDDLPGHGDAGHLADHAHLQHLRLDLPETGQQGRWTCAPAPGCRRV